MPPTAERRPGEDEYASYYGTYVDQVADRPILTVLEESGRTTLELLRTLRTEQWGYRYAEGKWSIAQLVRHVIDTEWIFVYRALRFGRGDTTELPGVDQDDLLASPGPSALVPDQLVAEFEALRPATLRLFGSFGDQEFDRRGTASSCEFTVRALAYIIAGHEHHHVAVLRDRYLAS